MPLRVLQLHFLQYKSDSLATRHPEWKYLISNVVSLIRHQNESNSILHLFSSLTGWKAPNKKKTEFVTIFSCPEQNTLNITEPSNLPRYPHDYTPLTKPRLKDKHHWYWNPYDFFWGDVSSKTGVTNPRGNHHHRWSLRPSYVITMAVMATASLSNLPRGSCDPQFDPPWHGIKPHLWK